jgi:hypothetical protein
MAAAVVTYRVKVGAAEVEAVATVYFPWTEIANGCPSNEEELKKGAAPR